MARSLSNAKLYSALIFDGLSFSRRGYAAAAASQGAVSARIGAATPRIGKAGKEELGRCAENSWIPDPVTGYYGPANRPDEIDVAELRELLLKQSKR